MGFCCFGCRRFSSIAPQAHSIIKFHIMGAHRLTFSVNVEADMVWGSSLSAWQEIEFEILPPLRLDSQRRFLKYLMSSLRITCAQHVSFPCSSPPSPRAGYRLHLRRSPTSMGRSERHPRIRSTRAHCSVQRSAGNLQHLRLPHDGVGHGSLDILHQRQSESLRHDAGAFALCELGGWVCVLAGRRAGSGLVQSWLWSCYLGLGVRWVDAADGKGSVNIWTISIMSGLYHPPPCPQIRFQGKSSPQD